MVPIGIAPESSLATLSLGEMSGREWQELATLSGDLGVVSLVVDYAFRGRRRGVEMLSRETARAAHGASPSAIRPTLWREALATSEASLTRAVMTTIRAGERSRAFFCAVGEETSVAVSSPVRLPEFFEIGPHARLTEIALAEPASSVRGVIGVTRARLVAAEFWGPHARAEWTIPIGEEPDRRHLQGPAHGGAQRAVLQRDRLARRRERGREREIADASAELAARAVARGWTLAVVGGDVREVPRAIGPLSAAGVPAVPHGRHVESHAERLVALDAADAEGDRQARSRLAGSGPGALRELSTVRAAIAERRATEIFLGARPLTASHEVGHVETAESHVRDEVVRSALAAGIPVTPIHDGGALGVGPGTLVAAAPSTGAVGPDDPVRPGHTRAAGGRTGLEATP